MKCKLYTQLFRPTRDTPELNCDMEKVAWAKFQDIVKEMQLVAKDFPPQANKDKTQVEKKECG